MAACLPRPITACAPPSARGCAGRVIALPRPELAALLVLAGALNLWALSRNGWANEYYAGAVRSMVGVVARVPLRITGRGRA